jgi:hypothetical protein
VNLLAVIRRVALHSSRKTTVTTSLVTFSMSGFVSARTKQAHQHADLHPHRRLPLRQRRLVQLAPLIPNAAQECTAIFILIIAWGIILTIVISISRMTATMVVDLWTRHVNASAHPVTLMTTTPINAAHIHRLHMTVEVSCPKRIVNTTSKHPAAARLS